MAACTHRAPIESTDHPPTREGLAQALSVYSEAPSKYAARLRINVADQVDTLDGFPPSLASFRLRPDGTRPVLSDLYSGSCPSPCPEPLTGRRAYLLDNVNKKVIPIEVNEAGLMGGLKAAQELGNQSVIAVDFGLEDFPGPVRWGWTDSHLIYVKANDDLICEFGNSTACRPIKTFSRVAIITNDLDFTYLDASVDVLERLPELREANPDATIRIERLISGRAFNPGPPRIIHTFGEDEFCGVFGDPGRFAEYCFQFSDLRSVRTIQRGPAELWSVEDYARFPLRLTSAVILATAMMGGSN